MSVQPLSHRRPTLLKSFLFGSAYYPEHWDAATRAHDAEWMQQAGWNCVRLGEFSWTLFEPKEGRYDFSFYDEQIELLSRKGIAVILGTPTAAPPAWMTRAHPEFLRWNSDDVPLEHGSRQHASHMSPLFRSYSKKITRAMARHFRGNPNVIGWQTDNEFHCHFFEDHSPAAQKAFVAFLKEKYEGDIDRLNQTWGNMFWALTYSSFDQIRTPRPNKPTHLNPTHVLDYQRFLSRAVTVFQRDQVDILRATNPKWFVTHNGLMVNIDYRGSFTQDLDFLSYNSYPFFDYDPRHRPLKHAANLDYFRAYSGNFVVMEQQSGPGGQGDYLHDTPEPGEMRRMAYASIARGADGVLFFRWRTCRYGAEEFWCGVLDHDNIRRRRYDEAAQMGKEIASLGPRILGTSVRTDIGIAGADFDHLEGLHPITHGLPTPKKIGEGIHGFFYRRGYAVGFAHPADLDKLSVYFIPHFTQVDPAWLPALEQFVERGGLLVIGARTGTRDTNGHVIAETAPGLLRALAGVTVEEFGRQNAPQVRPLAIRAGRKTAPTSLWYEILQPGPKTRVLAKWVGRHLEGQPAITARTHGRGTVIYVGSYFEEPLLEILLQLVSAVKGFPKPLPGHRPGLQVTCREGAKTNLWFYLNETDQPIALAKLPEGRILLPEETMKKPLQLGPNGVLILEESR